MSVGPLNLADADIKGFDALDPGRYNAEVFALETDAVKNTSGTGKMPAGTPMIKVQFRVLNPKIDGQELDQDRRVFTQFVVPPKDYDQKKASTMKGMIARFFIALGDKEESVISNKFDPMSNPDDYVGRQCVIVIGKEPKLDSNRKIVEGEYSNPVKGVKPAGSAEAASGGLL